MGINREYTKFKFLRNKRYKNRKEKIDHYNYIQYNDVHKFRDVVEGDYEDKFHVYWSWKTISFTISLIFLFASIFYTTSFFHFLITMGVSIVFMIIHLIFKRILNKTSRNYGFLMMMVQKIIEEGNTEPPEDDTKHFSKTTKLKRYLVNLVFPKFYSELPEYKRGEFKTLTYLKVITPNNTDYYGRVKKYKKTFTDTISAYKYVRKKAFKRDLMTKLNFVNWEVGYSILEDK